MYPSSREVSSSYCVVLQAELGQGSSFLSSALGIVIMQDGSSSRKWAGSKALWHRSFLQASQKDLLMTIKESSRTVEVPLRIFITKGRKGPKLVQPMSGNVEVLVPTLWQYDARKVLFVCLNKVTKHPQMTYISILQVLGVAYGKSIRFFSTVPCRSLGSAFHVAHTHTSFVLITDSLIVTALFCFGE